LMSTRANRSASAGAALLEFSMASSWNGGNFIPIFPRRR
jgi:hypothetical protein